MQVGVSVDGIQPLVGCRRGKRAVGWTEEDRARGVGGGSSGCGVGGVCQGGDDGVA